MIQTSRRGGILPPVCFTHQLWFRRDDVDIVPYKNHVYPHISRRGRAPLRPIVEICAMGDTSKYSLDISYYP